MKSDATNIHPSHITMEELELIGSMDADAISPKESAKLMELYEKIEDCNICQARYRYFLESEATLAALQSAIPIVTFSIADLLQVKLAAFDIKIQEKIEAWLDGAQNLLGSLEQASFQTAPADAIRGTKDIAKPDTKKIIPIAVGDGSFEFELSEKTDLIFRIQRKTEGGLPVCLVITGRSCAEFSEVYSLSGLELPGIVSPLLDSPKITLESGEYTFCVPTIEKE